MTGRETDEEPWVTADLFRGVFENSPIGMALTDKDGRCIHVNRAFAQIFGYGTPDQLVGVPIGRVIHRDDRQVIGDAVQKNVSEGRTYSAEFRGVRADRSIIEVFGAATIVRDAHGELVGVSQWQDITERKRRADEIQRLNTELEQRVADRTVKLQAANRELEAFVYSISHDLRAPLRAVDGFSRLVLERYSDRLDREGEHYIARIHAGVERMVTMIDDLLVLSRISRRELQRQDIDLSALAHVVAAELRSAEPDRHVGVTVEEGLHATADPGLTRVVLENLLGNAWKFTSSRERACIEVGEHERDGRPAFFVRDDGVGFEPSDAGDLFQPFVRLHRDDEFPGTGLGLASVQRIVARHGGRVWAESRPGAGATFNFTLDS